MGLDDYISVEEIIRHTDKRQIEYRVKIALNAYLADLIAENEKLRELVKQMFHDCGQCNYECYRPMGNCKIITTMEVLGIEVDDEV